MCLSQPTVHFKNQSVGKACSVEATFFLTRDNFFPSFPFGQGVTGMELQTGQVEVTTLQQFRNTEKSLENNVQCFRTCKEPSVGQGGNKSSRLANRKQQRGRGVVGPKKLLNELMSDHLSTWLLTTWKTILENMPDRPHWSVTLMAVLQQVEWIMEGRMICFVQVIAGQFPDVLIKLQDIQTASQGLFWLFLYLYPNPDKTRLLDKPVTSLLKESHFF